MRDKLNSAQHLALVAITRCFRTTSTVALQVLAGCVPLDLQVELEHNMAQLRRFRKVATLGDTKIFPSEVQCPLAKWANHPAKALTIDWEVGHPFNRGIEVFTDGSRMGGNVGSGVAMYKMGSFLRKDPSGYPLKLQSGSNSEKLGVTKFVRH